MNHVSLQKLLESRTDQSSENSMAMAEFRTAILQAAARVEFEAAEQLDPDQLDIFRRHTEILYKYAIAGYNLSEAQSDQLLEALAIAHSYETTFGTRGLTPSEDLKGGASTFRSVTYQIAKNVMIFSSQVPMYELVADEIGAEQLLIPDTRIQQGPLFPTDSKLLISTISFTFDPGQHFSELLAAIQCDHLLINRRDSEVLLEQWRVSLTPFGTKYAEIIGSLKEGFLVVIRERELSLELSRADVVAGLYIMQFADGVSRGRASPTLFNQVERHLEESAIDDPVRWAAARYQIAAGYSLAFTDMQFSPIAFKRSYEQMAQIVCNSKKSLTAPSVLFRIEEGSHTAQIASLADAVFQKAHQCSLLETTGRETADMLKVRAELLYFLAVSADYLTPMVLKERQFCTLVNALPDLLKFGLRIERIINCIELAHDSGLSKEMSIRLAFDIVLGVYGSDKGKPWWFKEDFDLCCDISEIRADDASLLSEIASEAGFAYTRVVSAYSQSGKKLAALPGLEQSSVVSSTTQLVHALGIADPAQAGVCLELAYLWMLELEPHERRESLKFFCQLFTDNSLGDVVSAALNPTPSPLSLLPGIQPIIFRGLGEERAQSIFTSGIGAADIVTAIQSVLCASIEQQIAAAPLFGDSMLDTPLQSFFFNVSTRNGVALQVPTREKVVVSNPISKLMNFYRQLNVESGKTQGRIAEGYWSSCASSQVDPFSPVTGILSAVQIFLTPPLQFSEGGNLNLAEGIYEQLVNSLNSDRARDLSALTALRQLLELHTCRVVSDSLLQDIFSWLKVSEDTSAVRAGFEGILEAQRRVLQSSSPTRKAFSDAEFLSFKNEELDIGVLFERGLQQAVRQPRFMHLMVLLQGRFEHSRSIESFRTEALFAINRCINGSLNSLPDLSSPNTRDGCLDNSADVHPALRLISYYEELREKITSIESERELDVLLEDTDRIEQNARISLSRYELEKCLEHIGEALKRVHGAESSVEEFSHEVKASIECLKRALAFHWGREGFDFSEQIDRLVSTEFRIPAFLEALPSLARFEDLIVKPILNQATLEDQFSDTALAQIHTARTFAHTAWHWLQDRKKPEMDFGENSTVNLEGGWNLFEGALRAEGNSLEGTSSKDRSQLIIDSFPIFRDQMNSWALQDCVYGPIGGRCHFNEAANTVHVGWLARFLQLENTPFRLIHNSASLIYPGSSSSRAMRLYLLMLAAEGILDPRYAELQIGFPGRLHPELCAILGSSAMLGTKICAPFTPNSFRSNQQNRSQTGARMVAYDAYEVSGGRSLNLPFMAFGMPGDLRHSQNVAGRTDVLGRWHIRWSNSSEEGTITTIDDIDIVHAVGATLRQVQFGGPLAEVGEHFINRHVEILNEFKLSSVLKAEWVYLRESDAYNASDAENVAHFDSAVRPCMEAHYNSAEDFSRGRGPVFRVRENIVWLRNEASKIQEKMVKDPAWQRHVEALMRKPY